MDPDVEKGAEEGADEGDQEDSDELNLAEAQLVLRKAAEGGEGRRRG